jgi:hypothetical protein
MEDGQVVFFVVGGQIDDCNVSWQSKNSTCDHHNTKWQQHCHPPTWLAHSKKQCNSAQPQSGFWRDMMLSVGVHNPRQCYGGVSCSLWGLETQAVKKKIDKWKLTWWLQVAKPYLFCQLKGQFYHAHPRADCLKGCLQAVQVDSRWDDWKHKLKNISI